MNRRRAPMFVFAAICATFACGRSPKRAGEGEATGPRSANREPRTANRSEATEPTGGFRCPPSERVGTPSSPDPEAGEFTLGEALADLPGDGDPVAVIETSLGSIRCSLAAQKVPNAVANFVGLARGIRPWWDACAKAWVRRPFYDGLTFHRVIPGFMAQGGDPNGDGTGGPGYQFANEIHPELRHDRPGTLAYANAGPDTNGSQFYITVGRRPQLDGGYVVFGHCQGVDVVERIVKVPRDARDMPSEPVRIRSVRIERSGP